MKEIIDIVAAYDKAAKQGKETALATVVLVEGSAYRRAGARMLITEDGQLTGAISGGCLEGDALRKARLVILQQEPMLVTYDTMDDDDAKLGVGLGCNGIIHILIEPISEDANNPIAFLKAVISNRKNAVLVTLFSLANRKAAQPGTCLCLTGEVLLENRMEHYSHRDNLMDDTKAVYTSGRSENKTYPGDIAYTAFIELVKPQIALVIIGAGNDAMPLAQLAGVLGWDVTVIDGRPNYALPERFPSAQKVIVARPEQALAHLFIDTNTAFVLMTHNFLYEMALLKDLLPLNPSYLGILGPKKKLLRMLDELADQGVTVSDEQMTRIFGPVGLDIGSEGAEEIALSVMAEIKAVLSARKGYSLKYKPVPIHAPQPIAVNN
ncbi:alanine dehydrogenase [Mucilaginibacter sp. PAMC 26640]|nr:alanine dehydrogenase [Mucilaginibacter sp. PAMC 26640]